jgi:hypothetical protein
VRHPGRGNVGIVLPERGVLREVALKRDHGDTSEHAQPACLRHGAGIPVDRGRIVARRTRVGEGAIQRARADLVQAECLGTRGRRQRKQTNREDKP